MSTPEATARASMPAWLALAAIVIGLDQASKWIVLGRFAEYERLPVIAGLFDLTLVYNPGAAFSFLADAQGWQRWFFTVLALAASGFILYLLRHARRDQVLYSFALAMILGGALGNVIDRLVHHKVVDFLLFFQHPWYFPAFNLADSAITLGAICLILDEFLRWRRQRGSAAVGSS